jgi:predicted DCC family thiol-disulfide oxidoreductase YuxK
MVDQAPADPAACHLLYDGDCPLCSAFARATAVAEAEPVTKIDARQDSLLRRQATAAGMDLDYGIVVKHQGALHYGPDALIMLARRTPRNRFGALLYLPFRSRLLAKGLYPIFVRLCWLLLRLQHKSLIRNLPDPER